MQILLVILLLFPVLREGITSCPLGCDCAVRDRLDCSNVRLRSFSLRRLSRLPAYLDFSKSEGLEFKLLSCESAQQVKSISTMGTGIECSQVYTWAAKCKIKVSLIRLYVPQMV